MLSDDMCVDNANVDRANGSQKIGRALKIYLRTLKKKIIVMNLMTIFSMTSKQFSIIWRDHSLNKLSTFNLQMLVPSLVHRQPIQFLRNIMPFSFKESINMPLHRNHLWDRWIYQQEYACIQTGRFKVIKTFLYQNGSAPHGSKNDTKEALNTNC